MVDLPKVPRRLVLTEAPRAGISAETAAGPFAQASRALGVLGEGVEAAGVRIAEDEGLRAVQTGPDGKPEFAPLPPFLGRAGEAYNRAGQTRKMADLQTATEADYTKARLDYRGNPEGFQEWSKTYIDTLVSKETDDRMKVAVRNQLTSASNQAFRAIVTEKHNLDIEASAAALKKRQDLVENNINSLFQQGASADSPELKSLLSDRAALAKERVANPLFRYSQQEADLDNRAFETRNIALELVGKVKRVAESNAIDASGKPLGGIIRARAVADSILTDPRLNDLPLEQRHHYYRLATAEVRALSTENQVLVNQLNVEAQQWRRSIEKGDTDNEGLRDFLSRAVSAQAVKAWTTVTNAISLNEQLRGWFDRLPPDERTRVQMQLEGKLGNLADRIISAESGGDPFAQATTSTARGAGQFIEKTWLALIQRHRPDLAATATREELLGMRNIPELTREMVMRNAEESRYLLSKAGARTDDGAIYLAHFLGAGNAVKVLQAHSTQPISEVLSPEVMAANPGVFKDVRTAGDLTAWSAKKVNVPDIPAAVQQNPAFINAVRARQKQELDLAFPKIEQRIRQSQTVSDDELEQFGALVFSVGSDEQKQKALELAVLVRAGESLTTMSAKQRAEVSLQFSKSFANGSVRLESEVGNYARKLNQTISADYQRDPYDAAVRYGKRAPVAALDLSNPEAFSGALVSRVREQEWIIQQEGIGPFSLLRPAEATTLQTQLVQGDARQAAALLKTIQSVTNEAMVMATLGSEPIKAALSGMIRSGDTHRMMAAFSTLDGIYQRNRQQFEASFGKDVYEKLAVWQSNIAYRKPDEIADLMRKAEDPQFRTAREKLVTTMTEEANKISERDLLNHFNTKILGISFSNAQPSASPIQMQAFRQEFADIYASLRADGVDQTTATERAVKWAGQAWGVSGANGNRLMRRPPEAYLPTVNGSHDWAEREVKNEITRVLGPQYSGSVGGFVKRSDGKTYFGEYSALPTLLTTPSVAAMKNWDYSLVADPQTEGEIAKLNQWKAANPGKTPPQDLWPSYQLFVFDNDKRQIDLLSDTFQKTMEQGPFNVATALRAPTGKMRFKWSGESTVAETLDLQDVRQDKLRFQAKRDISRQLFPTVLSAGAVPIQIPIRLSNEKPR